MMTFEKIREVEMNERTTKDLQRLPSNFWEGVREYLQRKEKMTTSKDTLEIKNVIGTIKRLFEAREKKLLDLVIYTSKTGIPPDNMTDGEQEIFDQAIALIKKNRDSFFLGLKKDTRIEDKPKLSEESSKPAPPTKKILENKEITYIVKKDIKPFVGPDTKLYNLKVNDILPSETIPKPLKDLLIREEVIEQKK